MSRTKSRRQVVAGLRQRAADLVERARRESDRARRTYFLGLARSYLAAADMAATAPAPSFPGAIVVR